LEKQVFVKKIYIKMFYFGRAMTYAHTLVFYKSQNFKPRPKSKIQVFRSWQFWFFRTGSNQSTGQSTDVHKLCMCMSVDRPVDRVLYRTLAQVGSTGRSTDVPQRSYFWPLAVDRPVDRLLSESLTDSNSYIFWQFLFWDLIPTDFLGCFWPL